MYCEIAFENKVKVFSDPVALVEARRLSGLASAFAKLEEFSRQGYYLAGFFSYEAGYGFEPRLGQKDEFDFPLLYFGAYNVLEYSPHLSVGDHINSVGRRAGEGNWEWNRSTAEYFSDIGRIREYIAAGETYQITYCVKNKFAYHGAPLGLYRSLLAFQPVPYPAYLDAGDFQILSLSPELLLKKEGDLIITKPMKGTLLRDGGWRNNLFGAGWLHHDPKNRAENVMIADLLRNDLGKICRYGSVVTPRLFEVAKYQTVYQMTSTVRGRLLDEAIGYYDIFRALFPSGSVTGAPKLRAMEIIRELEGEERRIYTGAIGFITPQRELFFNVPIRTILLKNGAGEMGVGGGITHYSTAAGEYEECLVKARFLKAAL
ncbi:MAG: chorismate-binding protein [Candidatus Saganbacteria bacterium]|nr:chorismate-binding protein [Candidatus Saganbacteria bacterium]